MSCFSLSSAAARPSARRAFVSALTIAVLALGLVGQANAQKTPVVDAASRQTGSIRGSLTPSDSRSKAIAGVTVSVLETGAAVTVDKNGSYSIPDLAPGTYTLIASGEGYSRLRITDVVVRPGTDTSLSLQEMPSIIKDGEVQTMSEIVVSAKKDVETMDKYVVEDTKAKPFTTPNIDLTRTPDDVLPFNVFTAQEIEQSGAQNLSEFFRNRLSQNFATIIPEEDIYAGPVHYGRESANTLNFANGAGAAGQLGQKELIILLNGRRLPPRYTGSDGDNSAITADFRGIPIASIERVELLSSAASALYGAGATGGVINIITKQDYRGGSISLGYENPLDANGPKRSAEFDYALPIKYGLSLRLDYSYSDSTPLNLEDRADVTVDRYRRIAQERDPSVLLTAFPLLGATANIRSRSSTGLFGPGTAIYTSVPPGYTGGLGLTPFLARQGVYNYALPLTTTAEGYGEQSTLGPKIKDRTLAVGLDQALGKNWRATLEYRRSTNEVSGKSANNTQLIPRVIPAAAITNPFGQDVRIHWVDPRLDLPGLDDLQSEITDQTAFTLRGNYGDWRGIVDLSYQRVVNRETYVEFDHPLMGWDAAIATGVYNPFVDMNAIAPAPASFYEEYYQNIAHVSGETRNYQGSAKLSGPIWVTRAGAIEVTAGVEWVQQSRLNLNSVTRVEDNKTHGGADAYDFFNNFNGYNNFRFDTYSAYAEVNLPLVSPKQQIPGVYRLELFSSGRLSDQVSQGHNLISVDYDATFTNANYVSTPFEYKTKPSVYIVGFRYDPIAGVTLRASRSVGFAPPTLSDVAPALPPTDPLEVIDRRTGQTIDLAATMYISGGNSNLRPETTQSTNFGVILEPPGLKGFRLSADYTENRRDDAITSLDPQTVLDLEASDPRIAALVRRDASGAIAFVDSRSTNFNQIVSKTLDLRLEQRVENVLGGRLVLTAAATKNLSFKVQTSADAPVTEEVRNPEANFYFPVEWNANSQVRWEGRQWTFGWSLRYYDDVLSNPSYYKIQGSDRVEWAVDHDVFAAYRFRKEAMGGKLNGWLADTSVTIGIKNLCDRKPRFSGDSPWGFYGADSTYGRSIWIQLRRSF